MSVAAGRSPFVIRQAQSMGIPQRLTFVTLGARSVTTLRRFYREIGWTENDGASDTFASFDCGSVKLALYPIELLRAEAAADAEVPKPGAWSGITLAINFADRAQVREAWATAVEAGATAVAEPVDREWGGYSGYIADPEGNRWELAWAPGFDSF